MAGWPPFLKGTFEPGLRAIESDAIDKLHRLVVENSYTRNRDGVVRNADLIAELFEPLGFAERRERSTRVECGDHLILSRDGHGDRQLVMVSHLDTVYPPDLAFAWRVDGDWIYGPGVCDIKGGTILMWMILRTLRDVAPGLFEQIGWRLLFNASEEGGCADFPLLARAEVNPATAACLVYEAGFPGEDGSGTIVTARKGCGRFRLKAFGRAAHSGNDHQRGASAIRELAAKVALIERMTDYDKDQTFNVGLIKGGSSVNSIPAYASCDIDVRSWTAREHGHAKQRLEQLAAGATVKSADGEHACRLELTELPGYPPWPRNVATQQVADLALSCAAALEQPLTAVRRKGGSDGCHLWAEAPTLDGLGPCGRDPHTTQERVDRTSLVPRALLSLALIYRLAAAP